MSKINILRTIQNIRSQSNVFTPIIEAIVNSIESIQERSIEDGLIRVIVSRENILNFDVIPNIKSIKIIDNGIGFTEKNRDSFDTFYSEAKSVHGGKGFGRFMFLKYFNDVTVSSTYLEKNEFKNRTFSFGKKYQIIESEKVTVANSQKHSTTIVLDNLKNPALFDKNLEVFARKLFEKILIYFINTKIKCPIVVVEDEYDNSKIVLNDFLSHSKEIQSVNSRKFHLISPFDSKEFEFEVKIFKIYFAGNQKSRISLTAHNREVNEIALETYIPEFADEFYDEVITENGKPKQRNFIIKSYVLSEYLDSNVHLEREGFIFEKDKTDFIYPFSRKQIEEKVAQLTQDAFSDDVQSRINKKIASIKKYVNDKAPWHKPYFNDLDLSKISFNSSEEKFEAELQRLKFNREQEAIKEIGIVLSRNDNDEDERLREIISQITDIGKSDLVHYVCNRKIVLQTFKDLLKRRTDNKAHLEKEIHNLIYPMGKNSDELNFEKQNLWLLDERLVFSEFIASDQKISSKKKDDALGEPDLIIFNKINTYRNGTNEFSNPITIFEFKRPKREDYAEDEDPITQIGEYLEKIRAGKYELQDGSERIKANDNTPVYAYVICDITDKIKKFAQRHQMTISPDNEGYFGFHNGYKMYVEIISFKKMFNDAELRNKIFFKKLQLE